MPLSQHLLPLLLLPAVALPAVAQLAPPPPPDNQIHLAVVVTARKGGPIGELKQSDFTLLDNKAQRPITSFREVGKPAPVEVVIVVDAVNARIQTVGYEREQLDKYFLANGGELSQPTSIAVLTEEGIRAQGGATRDGKVLKSALDAQTIGFRSVGRSAGFYGAQERLNDSLGALRLLMNREAARPGRKLIVWVSPGWPILSGPRVELSSKEQQGLFGEIVQLSTQMRLANVTLYNVNPLGAGEGPLRANYYESYLKGIAKPSQVDIGDLALQVLSIQTGGLVLLGSNDTAGMIQQAEDDAAPYYELSFAAAPGEHPNEYHSIDIKMAQPGESARTRTGYYAQPSGGPSTDHAPDVHVTKE